MTKREAFQQIAQKTQGKTDPSLQGYNPGEVHNLVPKNVTTGHKPLRVVPPTQESKELDEAFDDFFGSSVSNKDQVSWIDIVGLKVPFISEGKTSSVTSSGDIITESRLPVHVSQIQLAVQIAASRTEIEPTAALKQILKKRLPSIKQTLAKEMIRYLQPGVKVSGDMGRIALTESIDPGEVVQTKEHFILPSTVEEQAWDSDGDLIFSVEINDIDRVLIKNPITVKPKVWREVHLSGMKPIDFFNFDEQTRWAILETAPTFKADEEEKKEIFFKTMKTHPIGLITMACHLDSLGKKNGEPYETFIQKHLPHPEMYDRLETGALKTSRKDGVSADEYITTSDYMISAWLKPFFTNTGSIGNVQPENVEWLFQPTTNIPNIMKRICDIDFKVKKRLPTKERKAVTSEDDFFEEEDTSPITKEPQPYLCDGSFIQRMIKLGALQIAEVPHKSGIPAVMITLHNKSGDIVGLTDTKQENHPDGLLWQVYLLPVWSVKHQRLLHPIEWLQLKADLYLDKETTEYISGVDTTIRNPANENKPTRLWPSNWKDIENPKYGMKIGIFQDFILNHTGIYGLTPPVIKTNNTFEILPIAKGVIQRTIMFDFDGIRDLNEQWEAFNIAVQSGLKIAPAVKTKDPKPTGPIVKKYVISEDGLYPDWANKGNPRRSAQIGSQLLRSLKSTKLKVAFVLTNKPGTSPEHMLKQLLITPSGTEKLSADITFGHIVLNEPPEEDKADLFQETHIPTLQGTTKVVWVGSIKGVGAKYPKIVDKFGTKSCPLPINQVVSIKTEEVEDPWKVGKTTPSGITITKIDGDEVFGLNQFEQRVKLSLSTLPTRFKTVETEENIDLLYPIGELLAKDLHFMLEDATQTRIVINGKEILAYVPNKDLTFHRTGAASENSKVRRKTRFLRGFDAHMYIATIRQYGLKWCKEHQIDNIQEAIDERKLPDWVEKVLTTKVTPLNLPYVEALREVYFSLKRFVDQK